MPKPNEHIAALKGIPEPLLLMDATGLVFRAYYSIRELTSPAGVPVNAVFGVLKMILKVVHDVKPKGCAAFFDTARRTFRTEQYAEYKANRPPPPDTLIPQIPIVIEGMEACGCPALLEPGYEADDLIASFVAQHPGDFKLILSSDRDMLQLIDDKTYVLVQTRGVTELKVYTPDVFRADYGFGPELFVDYKALRGDPSDNIPGVKGVGEKVKPERIRKALEDAREEVFQFRELVTLKRDCEPPGGHGEACTPQFSAPDFIAYLEKYGLRAIKKQVSGGG